MGQLTMENQAPSLSRETRLANTIVLVDGLGRAGKSMMAPILSSFDRIEIERLEASLEYAATLFGMGKITQDAAVSLLRLETDAQLYNSLIGRNTNFRLGDHSCVWRSPNRWRYFKRLFSRQGPPVLQIVNQTRPIYQNVTHSQLASFELYYEAFGQDLRILEMVRHPVDVIEAWLRRGWGTRIGTDPLSLAFCVVYGDQEVPFHAIGWEETYLSTSPTGRVTRMIQRLWDKNQATFAAITSDQQRQVLFIPFESFIEKPWPYIDPLGDFIGSTKTRHTASALKRQKCPRKYDSATTDRKRLAIEEQASPEERDLIQRLVEEYEALSEKVAL